jgi:hypothetical protein
MRPIKKEKNELEEFFDLEVTVLLLLEEVLLLGLDCYTKV